jgi:adenosyl cobinamide kinase/adenosyl cobinamide phosphate guanylyltransferase
VTFILLTGGARSGKSSTAIDVARSAGAPVTFVATAVPGDDDLRARVAAHRSQRPEGWTTVEEPTDLERAIDTIDGDATVVVDCITFWVFNRGEAGDDADTILAAAERLAVRLAARGGTTIVVTNEVGSGVVPATESGGRYRDLLGAVNASLAARADRVLLMVVGRALDLRRPEEIL